MNPEIRIRNARTHNLKGIDLNIPRNRLTVITGRSGSGKSSLAIDTLFAEGQRQFVESLSLYSRNFFKQLPKADVDSIEGLPPTVCLDQKRSSGNRRSTVGTATEIYDYLRLLMARAGTMHCANCQHPIVQHSCQQIVRRVMELAEGTKLMVLAPLAQGKIDDPDELLQSVRRERLVRVRIDGTLFDIDQIPPIDTTIEHSIEAVVDRIIVRPGGGQRALEAIELATHLAQGKVILSWIDQHNRAENSSNDPQVWHDEAFSNRYQCPRCDHQCEEVQPRLFSFNHPLGACPVCQGLGEFSAIQSAQEMALPDEGSEDQTEEDGDWTTTCQSCGGSRLSPAARSVRLGNCSLADLVDMSIVDLINFFETLALPADQQEVLQRLAKEILTRLRFLEQVGVGYLSLNRGIRSLSGGEHQRVRLSTAIGSGLAQIGYILDEPTIGLHPRDNDRLLAAIRQLQAQGNTMVLVEHDEAVIREADFIVDIGPLAGAAGGYVVATGNAAQIVDCRQSLTGDYLAGRRRIERSSPARKIDSNRQIQLIGANHRNLKNIDVAFPLDCLVLVTGVSGSGKSTLVNQTLVPALRHELQQRFQTPRSSTKESRTKRSSQKSYSNLQDHSHFYNKLIGGQQIDRLVVVDQSPPGHAQRGCPATAIDIFDPLRRIMAATKKAKQLGFSASRFSYNSKSGWCPDCRGLGVTRLAMQVVPDIFVDCQTCRGRRYNLQTLQVKFNDHSIADILEMPVDRACEFLDGFEEISRPLRWLVQIGLGYLRLGQSTATLSGGEAQRLKLAAELAKPERRNTLYVLDEPTMGLHFEDLKLLLLALDRLIEQGNSLIMIEHNLDMIRAADWVIDLGPEGGQQGGELVACGSPEQIATDPQSITGHYLAK